MKRLLLLILSALASFAATSEEDLTARFLAPCCWHENLAVHASPAAEQMRSEIARFVRAGKTADEITEYYVQMYGERILREPRGQRGIWLMLVPVVLLGAGFLFLAAQLRRIRPVSPSVALPPVSDDDWF
jgi:cytochrome c-type biogenesis protein CcmH